MWALELGWASRLYRRAPWVEVTDPQGNPSLGRGTVAPLKKDADQPGDQRHPLGALTRPRYRFTGWLAEGETCVGGTLTQGGVAYRVLDCRPVTVGSRVLCLRCLLERKEGAT